MPHELEDIEKQITNVSEQLSDASLYTNNPKLFDELSLRLLSLQNEKEQKENQWLELQILAESINN